MRPTDSQIYQNTHREDRNKVCKSLRIFTDVNAIWPRIPNKGTAVAATLNYLLFALYRVAKGKTKVIKNPKVKFTHFVRCWPWECGDE